MRHRVVWLREAQDALRRIHERREAFQQGAGKRTVRRIRDHTRKLAEFPESGRILPEAGLPVLRELVIPPYRLIYCLKDDQVEVLTIFHGAMDLNLEE